MTGVFKVLGAIGSVAFIGFGGFLCCAVLFATEHTISAIILGIGVLAAYIRGLIWLFVEFEP